MGEVFKAEGILGTWVVIFAYLDWSAQSSKSIDLSIWDMPQNWPSYLLYTQLTYWPIERVGLKLQNLTFSPKHATRKRDVNKDTDVNGDTGFL